MMGNEEKEMKKSIIAAAFGVLAAGFLTVAPAHADPSENIVVNGQTIDPTAACRGMPYPNRDVCLASASRVGCVTTGSPVSLSVGSTALSGMAATARLTPGDSSTVTYVELSAGAPGGQSHVWHMLASDKATAVKTGKTYKLTGTVTPTAAPTLDPTGPSVPFELDVTCP